MKVKKLLFSGVVKTLVLLLCLIVLHGSCHVSKKTLDSEKQSGIDASRDYIMTVLVEFNDGDHDDVSLYDIITSEGFLKNELMEDVEENYRYKVVFASEEGDLKIVKSISDPLNKTMEYVDDHGMLAKKEVHLKSDIVALRVNYNQDLTALKIYEQRDSEWALIQTFSLKN